MTGEYMHTLDAKGRLAVPSRLRDELGGIFYVTLSMDRCLSAYSAESWQRFSDKVDAMPFVKQRRMRPLFAFAARCEEEAEEYLFVAEKSADASAGSTVMSGNPPPLSHLLTVLLETPRRSAASCWAVSENA